MNTLHEQMKEHEKKNLELQKEMTVKERFTFLMRDEQMQQELN